MSTQENTKGALLLLPNLIGEHRHHQLFFPQSVDKAVNSIDGLIAESEGAARRFLGRFSLSTPIHLIPVAHYKFDSSNEDLDFLLQPIIENKQRWGMISDAGLPCIADPGYLLVRRAKELGIAVQAFVGPCSLTMALMLSGLNAQRFSFHGYLAKDDEKKRVDLLRLEKDSKYQKATQMFMETPYRNQSLLQGIIEQLQPTTMLCVAWELTTPEQGVMTFPIAQWRKMQLPNLHNKNALFLISA